MILFNLTIAEKLLIVRRKISNDRLLLIAEILFIGFIYDLYALEKGEIIFIFFFLHYAFCKYQVSFMAPLFRRLLGYGSVTHSGLVT